MPFRSLCLMVVAVCLGACDATRSMEDPEERVIVRSPWAEVDPSLIPSDANVQLFRDLSAQAGEGDPEFEKAVREAANELLPLAMACLARDGVHFNFYEPSFPEKRWVGRNRMRGALLFMFLREDGRSAAPELIGLLEDGQNWDGRHEVACAFNFMGPSGSAVIPIAMRDLDSEDTHIRQHALRILGGVGGRSEEALDALKEGSLSKNSDEQSEAVWGLKMLMEDEDSDSQIAAEAKAHLIALATGEVEGAHSGTSAMYALGFAWDSTRERVIELIEDGVLDPESPSYQSHIRKISGPEDLGVY